MASDAVVNRVAVSESEQAFVKYRTESLEGHG
jgi:hypothetical protein